MGGSIRARLVVFFGFIFVVVGLAAGVVIVAADAVRSDVSFVERTSLPAAGLIGQAHLGAAEYQADQLEYLLASSSSGRDRATAEMERHGTEVDAAFAELAGLTMTPPGVPGRPTEPRPLALSRPVAGPTLRPRPQPSCPATQPPRSSLLTRPWTTGLSCSRPTRPRLPRRRARCSASCPL
jgi:hypothetical protein